MKNIRNVKAIINLLVHNQPILCKQSQELLQQQQKMNGNNLAKHNLCEIELI